MGGLRDGAERVGYSLSHVNVMVHDRGSSYLREYSPMCAH